MYVPIRCLPMWNRIRVSNRIGGEMLLKAGRQFGLDNASRMAAAIAYRTVFALTPLLIIAVAVLGAVVGGSEEAQSQILETIDGVAGPSGDGPDG